MLEELKQQVLEANLELARSGLVSLTWGNVSGLDRRRGLVAIKPSGVEYSALTVETLVVLDLDGRVVEGRLKPSSDTPTHLVLYQAFPDIGGITHAHSVYATMFAQACREIPCLGTTHADQFCGPIPVTRALTPEEVRGGYEVHTGRAIVERFAGLSPLDMPAALAAHHGPFTWGRDAADSVKNGLALETVAKMAWGTLLLDPGMAPIPRHLLDKHWQRKHGPKAYYGQ